MATDRHQAPSYPLRMPEELRTRVQQAAEKSGRSVHAELLFRLEQSFAEGLSDPLSNPKRERFEAFIQTLQNRAELIEIRLGLLHSRIEAFEVGQGNIEREAATFERTGAPEFAYTAQNKDSFVAQLEAQKQPLIEERDGLLKTKAELKGQIAAAQLAIDLETEARFRFLESTGAKNARNASV